MSSFGVTPAASAGAGVAAQAVPLRAWLIELGATRQANSDVHSRHKLHQTLSWGLPWSGDQRDRPLVQAGPHGRLLWHLSPSGELIVQAPEAMGFDPERIFERHPRWGRVRGSREILPEAWLGGLIGHRLLLRADVSAQARPRDEAGKMMQRGLTDGALLAWLAAQGERCGFEVCEVFDASMCVERQRRAGAELPLPVQQLELSVRVADPLLMAAALRHGVGRAKSLGCGLLRLSPL